MKITLDGVPDDIFTALFVAKYYGHEKNLKQFLQIEKNKGIKNTQISSEIKAEYKKYKIFNIELNSWQRYEIFFDINYAVISKKTKQRISFVYKSNSWHNMIFLRWRKEINSIAYLELDIKEIFPLLPKNDSFVSLPLVDIFNIFGLQSLNVPLTQSTHKEWQSRAQANIKVYQLINGSIHYFDSLISLSKRPYEDTILLIAKNPTAYQEVKKYLIFHK